MAEWPPIDDLELRARLALGQEDFVAHVRDLYESLPAREFEAATLAGAVEYPFARPQGPFHLRDDEVVPLADLARSEGEDLVRRFVDAADRHPILAIGSNGSPTALRTKFGHFEAEADREVLVLTGWLRDFDVGPSPQPAIYGAMPATIFPSTGTRARTALLWVTAAQLTQLAWSEINYLIGRLRTRVEIDGTDLALAETLVFVSRFGTFSPAGEPVALEAVAAEGRTAQAMSQVEILDVVAALALGPGERAEDLVRAIHEDLPSLLPLIAERVWPLATPFESTRWTRLSFPD